MQMGQIGLFPKYARYICSVWLLEGIVMQYIHRPEEEKLMEILTHTRMCYVSGPGGIGKTTMVKKLANEIENSSLIYLRDISSVNQLNSFIEKKTEQILFLEN